MASGKLISDDITYQIVRERTSRRRLPERLHSRRISANGGAGRAARRSGGRAGNGDPGDRGRRSARRTDAAADGPPKLSGLRRDIQYLFEAAEGRRRLRLSSRTQRLIHRADDNEESVNDSARDIRRADETAARLLPKSPDRLKKVDGTGASKIYTGNRRIGLDRSEAYVRDRMERLASATSCFRKKNDHRKIAKRPREDACRRRA